MYKHCQLFRSEEHRGVHLRPRSSTQQDVFRLFSGSGSNETHQCPAKHSLHSCTVAERAGNTADTGSTTERSPIRLLPQTTHLSTAACAVTGVLERDFRGPLPVHFAARLGGSASAEGKCDSKRP